MRNDRFKSSDNSKDEPSSDPEIDYSPKTYTVRQQIVFGLKLLAVIGAILFILLLIEIAQ